MLTILWAGFHESFAQLAAICKACVESKRAEFSARFEPGRHLSPGKKRYKFLT